MFLSAYHFDGDPAQLAAAYDQMLRAFPPGTLSLHVSVVTGAGITVYDACPSYEDFDAFRVSPEFRDTIAAAGLPAPRIEPLGDVYHAVADATSLAAGQAGTR